MAKYELGAALGGGGARGFAHLGVINALIEKGINIDMYAGVSAGAIVASFLAYGYSPLETFQFLRGKGMLDASSISVPKTGLLNLNNLEETLEEYFGDTQIEDLPKPLIVVVTNLDDGKVEYIRKGPLKTAVLASSSIPILFKPVKLNEKLCSDGGLFDNLPVKPLKPLCDKVLGISISPIGKNVELDNLIKIALRVFRLSVNANTLSSRMDCDILIEPEGLEKYDVLDSEHASDIFRLGYDFVKRMDVSSLEDQNLIERLINLFSPEEKTAD